MNTIKLSDDELLLMMRLVGHHTTGNALGRVYDQLYDQVRDRLKLDAYHLPPLPNAQKGVNAGLYGNRAIVSVNK